MKNFETIKKNRVYPAKPERSGGFVLLYVLVLSSIILAMALGVTNIALNEVKFSTSGKDANEAFFAADTGAECALYNDKGQTVNDPFPTPIPSCANNTSILPAVNINNVSQYIIYNLGSGKSCAMITVSKDPNAVPNPRTTIRSIGRSDCTSGVTNYVERELDVTY